MRLTEPQVSGPVRPKAGVQLQRVGRLVAGQKRLLFFRIAQVGKPDMKGLVQTVPNVLWIRVV